MIKPDQADHEQDSLDDGCEVVIAEAELQRRQDLFSEDQSLIEVWFAISKDTRQEQFKNLRKTYRHLGKSLSRLEITENQFLRDVILKFSTETASELNEVRRELKDFTIQIFFIKQKNSRSRLQVTRTHFNALCESAVIFPFFTEFVLSFGFKVREDDIVPPRCRIRRVHASSNTQTDGFECAYGLRYAERKPYNGNEEWSVRQTAVYQSLRRDAGPETWLLLSASSTMKAMVQNHVQRVSETKSNTPFELHLALIEAAIGNWRWYMKNLAERTSEQTSRIVAASASDGDDRNVIDFRINFDDRQNLKVIEDRVLDLIPILESSLDTVDALFRQWQYLSSKLPNATILANRIDIGLKDCLRDIKLQKTKAEILHQRIQGTAKLLSDLLDYENAKQAQANGISLKILAEEARADNLTMRKLTEKGTKDAEAVKIITIITIIYLPTSVVAGFFSTQFVFQKTREDGTPTLSLAKNWWIYAAVSVPLTVATIAVWYIWITRPWQKTRWYRGAKDSIAQAPRANAELLPVNRWMHPRRRHLGDFESGSNAVHNSSVNYEVAQPHITFAGNTGQQLIMTEFGDRNGRLGERSDNTHG